MNTPQSVPTLQGLAEYLHHQYPATTGDIALNELCKAIAVMEEDHQMKMMAISGALKNKKADGSPVERLPINHPYWTPVYADVCAAVDREMKLRKLITDLHQPER